MTLRTGGLSRRRLLDRGVKTGGAILLSTVASGTASAKAGPGGFSPDGLKAVTAAMRAAVDKGDAVGMVTLLYRHGAVAQVNAVGFQDQAAKTPMRRDTIFRIASMTKPIVSVAVQLLIEDGKLTLTTPVEKFLPELANPKLLKNPSDPLDSAGHRRAASPCWIC